MKKLLLALICIACATACAGPNPNPGERTTDMALLVGDFGDAFELLVPSAEAGEPWAQLRLGICYENGWGTDPDLEKAEYWYKKAAAQKASGDWAEGLLVGAHGKAGYFNQNSDARIAQFNLAQLYYYNDKNFQEALDLVETVIQESQGRAIFFCCEFSGGRSFTQEQFLDLRKRLIEKLGER